MSGIEGLISFIGIGSNISDPVDHCKEAIERIGLIEGIKILRSSSLYRTEPVGFIKQNWFVNAVVEVRTLLTPKELLKALKIVEREMGRGENLRWGPRIIDLDILLYNQDIIQEESLVIPHPELHKRRFVLVPLCEIAPYALHPAFGISIRGLADRLEDSSIVELI
jgi:2-amino-4-hydroxy-6-hydroxymethyldihydropteridine diphosphokinase